MTNEKLKIIRKAKNLNQQRFAELLGIKQAYYSELELGKKPITQNIEDKLISDVGVSKSWIEQSNGDIFNASLWGKTVGMDVVNRVENGLKKEKYTPYAIYRNLSEKDLDFELSVQIETFKDAYKDWKNLTEFLHTINPPQFLIDKFPLLPNFEEYRKNSESEFNEEHTHVKDENTLKVLKIVNLYSDIIDHIRSMLSKLIEYLHTYSELILMKTVRETNNNEGILSDDNRAERKRIKGKIK